MLHLECLITVTYLFELNRVFHWNTVNYENIPMAFLAMLLSF